MPRNSRLLIGLAWLNVVLHVIALVLADKCMRPGSPLVSLRDRLSFLVHDTSAWVLAWASWMLCAAALIAYLAILAQQLHSPLAQFALTVAVVGAAFDVFCDAIYMVVLPQLASHLPVPLLGQPPDEPWHYEVFLTVERIAGIGSMTIANGAYSLAILLLNVDLHRRRARRFTFGLGYVVAGFGFLLALADFTGVARHAEWATPPTIVLFCVWAVHVANTDFGERGASAP